MKKIIALTLCFAMVLSFSTTAVAANANAEQASETSNVMEIDNGHLYSSLTDEKTIAILTDDEQHLIDISIKYNEQPNTVYQWLFSDYPEENFTLDDEFWLGVISYAENQLDTAKVIVFTDEEPTDGPQARSSAGADLLADMKSIMGNEFNNRLMFTTTYMGEKFRISDDMSFSIKDAGRKSWSTTMSISSLIVSVLGLVSSTVLVSTLCNVFGVAISAASLIPAGKINKYTCLASRYRRTRIERGLNNGAFPYFTVTQYTEFTGYEDANNNSKGRAHVDSSSKRIYYSASCTPSLYSDYMKQVENAYYRFTP